MAIADRQTAVYPAVSPGGWNLIGRCPVRMFDPDANPIMPVAVGDREGLDAMMELWLAGQQPDDEESGGAPVNLIIYATPETEAGIAEFAAGLGVDEKLFRESYFSFPVETQIRKNIQKEKRYGHRGVPAIVVNGKYLVSASLAGSNERMIQIMNYLVTQELAQ